jgi:hypothetical protein
VTKALEHDERFIMFEDAYDLTHSPYGTGGYIFNTRRTRRTIHTPKMRGLPNSPQHQRHLTALIFAVPWLVGYLPKILYGAGGEARKRDEHVGNVVSIEGEDGENDQCRV